jgi:hypothetical protein
MEHEQHLHHLAVPEREWVLDQLHGVVKLDLAS